MGSNDQQCLKTVWNNNFESGKEGKRREPEDARLKNPGERSPKFQESKKIPISNYFQVDGILPGAQNRV